MADGLDGRPTQGSPVTQREMTIMVLLRILIAGNNKDLASTRDVCNKSK